VKLDVLREQPYEGYAYAYPHKTAYRPLDPPRRLDALWAREDKSALVVYAHVPVCEMRCGFCNLFTTVGFDDDFEARYVAALERQAERVRDALGTASFAAAAIGGGTPTHLSTGALARVVGVLERIGAPPSRVPTSVETSPRTAEVEKLALLRAAGVRRVSIGVQSFDERETRALGRAQNAEWVTSALDRIRVAEFPVLNIDLMYGVDGQDEASFVSSLERALTWRPEELYLYPLYVRPLTGMGRRGARAADSRVLLYRAGRARLLDAGYEQISMRFFRQRDAPRGPDTCCQEDGTVGLGCGARSYTRDLHYASLFAVGAGSVRAILASYLAAPATEFDVAAYGAVLSPEEQRRRYVLKTLLRRDGLSLPDYEAWFGTRAQDDFEELRLLVDEGLAARDGECVRLTADGLELSDAIGPLLYSPATRDRMAEFDLR
jgi:oxygen-independent coproporphyrinogen-3 oxidase